MIDFTKTTFKNAYNQLKKPLEAEEAALIKSKREWDAERKALLKQQKQLKIEMDAKIGAINGQLEALKNLDKKSNQRIQDIKEECKELKVELEKEVAPFIERTKNTLVSAMKQLNFELVKEKPSTKSNSLYLTFRTTKEEKSYDLVVRYADHKQSVGLPDISVTVYWSEDLLTQLRKIILANKIKRLELGL